MQSQLMLRLAPPQVTLHIHRLGQVNLQIVRVGCNLRL